MATPTLDQRASSANNYGAGGTGGTSSVESNVKIQQTQAQVNEVVDIMKSNVENVLRRGENLAELDSRAEDLEFGAQQFQSTATRVKRKYWWQNIKMWIILIIVILVIIIIIVVWVVLSTQK